MQTGVLVLSWDLYELEESILSVFLIIAQGYKAALYLEAMGVPWKRHLHIRSTPAFLSAYSSAEIGVSAPFEGPTLSQHIREDGTDVEMDCSEITVLPPLPHFCVASNPDPPCNKSKVTWGCTQTSSHIKPAVWVNSCLISDRSLTVKGFRYLYHGWSRVFLFWECVKMHLLKQGLEKPNMADVAF